MPGDEGRIIAIDGQTYSEKLNIMAGASSISAIRAFNINEDGIDELAFVCQNQLNVYGIHCSCLIWQTNILGSSAGRYNNLVVSDIDSDEAIEILIGTNYTVPEFKSNLAVIEDNDDKIYPGSTEKHEKAEIKKDLQFSSYSIYLSILILQSLLNQHLTAPSYNFQDWSQEYFRLNWLYNFNNINSGSYLPYYNWRR